MKAIGLDTLDGSLRCVLALGAHSDDIEIGASGTLRRLVAAAPDATFVWVVFAAQGQREDEARSSAMSILGDSDRHRILLHSFKDGFFPYEGAQLKAVFEQLKHECQPDIIFTHHTADLHQDHRLVGELTWNTFRNHLILEYEIPKYDGGLGSPNVFVPLTREEVDVKIGGLMRYFESQRTKSWFTDDLFLGLMRLRGVECQSPTNYAEAFYARKLILNP